MFRKNLKLNKLHECKLDNQVFKILFLGSLSNNKPNSFGVYYYLGDIYIGKMRNGKMTGYGIWKCRGGYRKTGRRYEKINRGIYIGFFINNKLFEGKVILKEEDKLIITYRKNYLNEGIFYIKGKNYYIQTNIKRNIFSGEYLYRNYAKKTYIRSFLKNGIMDGYCYREDNITNEELYYKKGKINGKSKIHFYKNNCTYILEWRNNFCINIRRISDRNNKIYNPLEIIPMEIIPKDYLCPISLEIMIDPVKTEMGQIYEHKNLVHWLFQYKSRDPLTNIVIKKDIEYCIFFQHCILDYIRNYIFNNPSGLYLK